jgi:hypothetical protein
VNAALAFFLGHHQPRAFEGTASERVTYECARRLWLEAAYQIRGQNIIRPTLGLNVAHESRWKWLTS